MVYTSIKQQLLYTSDKKHLKVDIESLHHFTCVYKLCQILYRQFSSFDMCRYIMSNLMSTVFIIKHVSIHYVKYNVDSLHQYACVDIICQI